MDPGFSKADSSTLPRVDALMVGQFFSSNPDFTSAEFRNIKTSMSSRQSYGDEAIGYVQLRREGNLCIVKCRICPEHKVRSIAYSVSMVVDEKECAVQSVKCQDCPASEGGCKHAVAFLMWVHRRSEEPACTSVECYWRKSNLAKVGTTTKYITTQELSKKRAHARIAETASTPSNVNVLKEFLEQAKKKKLDCQILKHELDFQISDIQKLSLHTLILKYVNICGSNSNKFLECISNQFTPGRCSAVEKETRGQHKSSIWHELRYGRITASKAYEVSRCKTPQGTLVAAVMGAKIPDTAAMKRGRDLENAVKVAVEKELKTKIKPSGLYISRQHPIIGASPDGMADTFIVEIKCPSSVQALKNYVKDGVIQKKYLAQIQIQMQMFLTNMKKCCFCVADPNF